MKTVIALAVTAVLAACGGTTTGSMEAVGGANHDISSLNDALRRAESMQGVRIGDLAPNGNSRLDGRVAITGFARDSIAIGELGALVDFDGERVAMNANKFALYSGGFVRNLDGGLAMTDGRFRNVTNGLNEPREGFSGTLTGSIQSQTVRAEMLGGFLFGNGDFGLNARSTGNSTHQVDLQAVR